MKVVDRLEALRSPWRVYFVVFATLGVIVLVFLITTWPQAWDIFAHDVLLRGAAPAAWTSPPSAASLSGCYTLVFSECVLSSGQSACLGWVPSEIELTMQRRDSDGLVVRTTGGARSSWSVTQRGTLHVSVSDGFSGVILELGPAAEGLRGVAHTWTDSFCTSQWAKVEAKRKQCGGAGF